MNDANYPTRPEDDEKDEPAQSGEVGVYFCFVDVIGRTILRTRKNRGMTIEELAALTGWAQFRRRCRSAGRDLSAEVR
jgi:hypothetical protein